ncbi:hypothetical protein M501DRAFT_481869 [Patellaria atrata CBS 101060]|uniref:Uncharacterized protein n=1 Tax=Patellaria atrata CBS 101060 TaxID=1346257 RepID=A0A9P4VJ78_9PEZI|nr:hypothetical protein M501DRAFT_481869 [Patellaria atrata CBS 101060]
MGKIDGKNNYEESKYMRKGASLSIPFPSPILTVGRVGRKTPFASTASKSLFGRVRCKTLLTSTASTLRFRTCWA